KLIQIDENQVELRVAADLSGDPEMIKIFTNNLDYHLQTAKLIAKQAWGLDPATITKESPERSMAKIVNFGLLYGMSDKGLAARLACPTAKATMIREAILGTFHFYREWMDKQI